MRPVLKSEEIPQLDAWSIVLFLIVIEFFSYLLLYLGGQSLFPSLPMDLLVLVVKVPIDILILLYCMVRFGRIDLAELIPDRRDSIVLILALLAEFWIFGLLIGPEGLRNVSHESIRNFSASQYWLAIFILVGWVPLLEEALFRRYFLEIQRQHYSTAIAVLITACVGTLFHFKLSLIHLLWHFFQEVFSSVVYVKSRLGVSVMVHAFINALVLFLSR